jgi:predicted amidophosphoribosyltransferase
LGAKIRISERNTKFYLDISLKSSTFAVIDDVTTSGSTLNEVLRTLRILNEDNNISIFSLIGRKDLMAESV